MSCKKFIEVNPPTTEISSENVYNNDQTAAAVLTGIYTSISTGQFNGQSILSINLFPGLSADELSLYGNANAANGQYYTNALNNNTSNNLFDPNYSTIYVANAAIVGLNQSSSLTPSIKQQLLGEAEFIRAFCYFYLVNLYGDVPLITGTNYKTNSLLPKTPKAQVYAQIIADLKDAQNLLSANYLDATILNSTQERTRPTKWAAAALLSRVYLYNSDPKDAETEASLVIGNTSFYGLTSLANTFLMNSNEAIWQLQPVNAGQNTQEAIQYVIPASGPDVYSYPYYLNSTLIKAFEPGDQRKTNWIDSVTVTVNGSPLTYYFPYKYKVYIAGSPVTEYEMVLRLGEQYLIRAEAEADGFGNGINGAIGDLNMIRNRAGLPNYNGATDRASLLTAILHEKQVELFTEWGNRWLDLQRSGTVNAVMAVVTPQKGGIWNSFKQLYPIPLNDLQYDPNLKQNPGY